MAVAERGKQYRLRNIDLSDREVLGLVDDAADNDGWAETAEIASNLWPKVMASGNGKAQIAMHAVSTRLAWMQRYGAVISEKRSGATVWALTDAGAELLEGRLTRGAESLLDKLSGAQAVMVAQVLATRDDDDLFFTLKRRAWQHGMAR